jgi:hypothetical protein
VAGGKVSVWFQVLHCKVHRIGDYVACVQVQVCEEHYLSLSRSQIESRSGRLTLLPLFLSLTTLVKLTDNYRSGLITSQIRL